MNRYQFMKPVVSIEQTLSIRLVEIDYLPTMRDQLRIS